MPSHKHRPQREPRIQPYTGPVTRREQNRAAHGNICEVSECACGATRRRNINGCHTESSGWIPACGHHHLSLGAARRCLERDSQD